MLKSTVLAMTALLFAASVQANNGLRIYEVTITNITKGQTFTPQLVVTHSSSVRLFSLGQPASPALEVLAEGGDTQPLTDLLLNLGASPQTIGGLLGPGETAMVSVEATRGQVLSLAAMLIPTNDTFVALDRIRLPFYGTSRHVAVAYDAGTELNDQNCANIPGPRCGGAGASSGTQDGDEGYVYVGNGFHELGADDGDGNEVLGPLAYDWRNPVALVTVRRVRQ
jgi:hypothetical protein